MRYLMLMAMLFLVTSCSELRVIGGAAMRELKADGISTEQARVASVNTTPGIQRW